MRYSRGANGFLDGFFRGVVRKRKRFRARGGASRWCRPRSGRGVAIIGKVKRGIPRLRERPAIDCGKGRTQNAKSKLLRHHARMMRQNYQRTITKSLPKYSREPRDPRCDNDRRRSYGFSANRARGLQGQRS